MSDTAPSKTKLDDDNGASAATQAQGHPKGLYVLFFAELWERFSFYGMRALLSLYMATPKKGTAAYATYVATKLAAGERPDKPGLGYTKKEAAGVYHAYGALVYAFPVIGGKLADSVLGYRTSIIIGGLLMAAGHFIMAIQQELFFYGALALIAVGNGFFKPNISSLVGKLYQQGDPRRDSGFTIFYMGINIGAMAAPLLCGTLGQRLSWHYGFGLAGVGMLAGLASFAIGRKKLQGHGEPPDPTKLKSSLLLGLNRMHLILLAAMIAVPITGLGLWQHHTVAYVLYAVGLFVLGYLLLVAFTSERQGRDRLLLVLVLMFFHTSFWAVFEQAGSSFTFLTDKFVDKRLFGFEIPTTAFQALNPLLIIVLAPIFAKVWILLHRVKKNPSIPMKFSLGNIGAGLGFGIIVLGVSSILKSGAEGSVAAPQMSLIWLLLTYLMHTLGELCLSPVGLSAITKLAPERAVGTVMGAWFLTISFAHELAGAIAGAITPVGFDGWTAIHKLTRYTEVYWKVGLVVAGLGVLLGLLSPLLKRLAHGVE